MAKIICITSGLTGILNASFELVEQLQSAGHELIYASPRKVGERVALQKIPFVQLPEIRERDDDDVPTFAGHRWRKLIRLKYKFEHLALRKQAALKRIYPTAFEELLEKEQADLYIIDIELHEYIFVAFSKKQNFVLLSQWFSLWKRPGLPYLLHDTIPGKGSQGKSWRIEWSWQLVKLKRGYTFWKKRWSSGMTNRRSALLALAEETNFPRKWIKENYWPGPFTYDQLPVISMTMEEMEFPHERRANLFYVGAMVKEQRVEKKLTAADEKRLVQAIDYKRKNGAALIYCSVSTLSQGDLRLVQNVIEAVNKKPEWVLVIGMGGLIDAKDLDQLSDNVFAFKWLPQLRVLKEANCSINHGGIHTINECIHFKVPMLIYSGKRSDQNGCAARVAYHQLGIMADKDQDGSEQIKNNLEKVLQNKVYQQQIAALHSQYLKKKEDCFVGQIINSFLRKNKLDKQ